MKKIKSAFLFSLSPFFITRVGQLYASHMNLYLPLSYSCQSAPGFAKICVTSVSRERGPDLLAWLAPRNAICRPYHQSINGIENLPHSLLIF